MTVQEYLATIQALVREARYTEAMAVSTLHHAAVLPLLTADEFVYLTSVMAVVDRAIEVTEEMPGATVLSDHDTLPVSPAPATGGGVRTSAEPL